MRQEAGDRGGINSTFTLATWCEELTHLKRPRRWERLRAGGEGDDRGWDGWMASSIQWTWIWVNSGSWWWTGRPGVLRFMGLQRVGHDWVTELTWNSALCGDRRTLHQQCPWETDECDLEANLHTGYVSLAAFGAHWGLGEYWKSYWLIQMINSLQLGALSKTCLLFIRMPGVNVVLLGK